MKRLFFILTAICAVNTFACAAGVGKGTNASTAEKPKTLVVYYSATHTTERVAKIIAELTDADLWELQPVKPYSDADLDWTDKNSRVVKEHDSENPHTELKNAVIKNWSDYDTVYVGAPHWWRKASWVIDDFLKQNDFGNKKVISFCTSMSTPYADTGKEMQKLARGGKWVEGVRFGTRATREEIENFVKRVEK